MGEREVLVVVLISLPYRYRWGGCGRRGAHLIRRRRRKAGWTAHRRRLYKVVDVHGIRVRGCGRSLRLLVDRAPQLLRNSAGCGLDGRPWGSGHGGALDQALALALALALAQALAQALALPAHTGSGVSNRCRRPSFSVLRHAYPLLRSRSAPRIFMAIIRHVRFSMRSAFGSCVRALL